MSGSSKLIIGHISSSDGIVTVMSGSGGLKGGQSVPPNKNYDTNFFVSGSAGTRGSSERGTSVFGGDTVVSGTLYALDLLSVGAGSEPLTALDVVHDYSTTTFENQLDDSEGGGEILKYGSAQAGAVGTLHFLHTDGSWDATDADAVATGASQLLGIALGASATTNGILLKGYFKVASGNVEGTAAIGAPVYISEVAGKFDFTAPSASADFVRIVGYCIDIDSSDILLRFDPSNDWVELA